MIKHQASNILSNRIKVQCSWSAPYAHINFNSWKDSKQYNVHYWVNTYLPTTRQYCKSTYTTLSKRSSPPNLLKARVCSSVLWNYTKWHLPCAVCLCVLSCTCVRSWSVRWMDLRQSKLCILKDCSEVHLWGSKGESQLYSQGSFAGLLFSAYSLLS